MILEEQNGSAVYSDGETVEEMMLSIAEQYPESAAADAIAEDSRYTVNNTFSPVRHNLLSWYPFKPGAHILEVGAGMGAMIGLLCDVAEHVTALEMNERRANVIRARYPARKNLTVVSADVTAWHTGQRFDYIVVVGVLEYAGVFSPAGEDEPYIQFLAALRRLLKPGGVVLLAIENRFGLKYWLGAAEDHLQQAFAGIEGYTEPHTPRTFSRAALLALFDAAGFEERRVYSVLPNYEFPTAIFTDDSAPSNHELQNIGYTYSPGTSLVAGERALYPEIAGEGMLGPMANSLLVEAGCAPLGAYHVLRVSARGECKPEYRVVTTIDSEGLAIKKAADPRARAHVKNTWENGEMLRKRGVAHIEGELKDGALVTRLNPAPMANEVFCDALNRGDWDAARAIIDKLAAALESASDATDTPSPLLAQCEPGLAGADPGPLMQDGFMDMTLYNAFLPGGELAFFDQEWRFPGLPLRFVLYYGLKTTYGRNGGKPLFPFVEIRRYIGVSEAEALVWDALEGVVWRQVLNRVGDVYGADGYCNQYSDALTMKRQKQEAEAAASLEKQRLLQQYNEELDQSKQALREGEEARLAEQKVWQAERDELEARQAEELEALRFAADAREDLQRAKDARSYRLLEAQKNDAYERMRLSLQQQLEQSAAASLQQAGALQDEIRLLQETLGYREAHIASLVAAHDYLCDRRDELDRILASRSYKFSATLSRYKNGIMRRLRGQNRPAPEAPLLEQGEEATQEEQPAPEAGPGTEPAVTLCPENYPGLLLPVFKEPKVSIVIPCYNQFGHTYNCIKSIADSCAALSYEVIVADDNSSDETSVVEQIVEGVRVSRNKTNLRFLLNCNRAAEMARGEYIVFLNNDTLVAENWLESMLELMEADGEIGLAGSKLVFANGQLQEAGGIIWADGSGWNYGRGQDPDLPEFNYVKEVDYISGCSIMIRAALWREIGGFDEQYAPAYYEDADLAFEVRRHGYKVVYQPASRVTHFEGVSNGTDLSAGQKQYQKRNHAIFIDKWREELSVNHYPCAQHLLRARDRTKNKKIAVFVDHYIPTFDRDAGSRTIYEYIELFMERGYHVILIPDNFYRSEPYADIYEQKGVEVLYGPYYSLHYLDWIRENGPELDVFFLNRPHIAMHYIDAIRTDTRAEVLYYGVDLHFLREQRQYEITKDPELPFSIARSKILEFELMHKSDCSFYPSYVEEETVREIDPSINVLTLPVFIYPALERAPYALANRRDLMFVGGFDHLPNRDAMVWFVQEVLPLVWRREPDITFHIMGSNPPEEVQALAGPGVRVHGYVSAETLESYYRKCRLSVVPLRYGAGIKGKVIEAMGSGIPVLTTSIGAEGIRDAGRFLAVEDEAEGFAARLCALYGDEKTLAGMASGGYDYIEATFSKQAANDIIDRALNA